jgi:hypothetical protein
LVYRLKFRQTGCVHIPVLRPVVSRQKTFDPALVFAVRIPLAVVLNMQQDKEPRWRFLTTPQSALLGDVLMFLNVICLQVLWNSLTASSLFWELLTTTPLGKPGSITDIPGRLTLIGV